MLISGCVPLYENYYKPYVDGGKAISTGCGSSTIFDTLEYELGDVTLEAKVYESIKSFSVGLYVPRGTSVSFRENVIYFRREDQKDKTASRIEYLQYYENKKRIVLEHPTSIIMEGDFKSELIFKFRKEFWMGVKFDFDLNNEFFVTLPAITVNGVFLQLPEIRFVKKRGFGFTPISC